MRPFFILFLCQFLGRLVSGKSSILNMYAPSKDLLDEEYSE